MSFDEFMKNKPKSVTGVVNSDGKLVKRTYYWSYSKYVDRVGWFNRNRGKVVTNEVAYTLYQEMCIALEIAERNNNAKTV